MLLKDKVVVISGVGPGLGRKLTLLATAEGAKVAIGCRNTAFLDGLAQEVRDSGGEVVSSPTDVKDVAQCNRLVELAAGQFGRIDGLVNSAYQYSPAQFEDADLDTWAATMDVTCFGALRMAQAVLPHMKKVGGGSIVNVSTMETRKNRSGEGAYSIPKAALEMATRQMAFELGKYKIRVNSTLMGWMWGVPVENALKGFAEQSAAADHHRWRRVPDSVGRNPDRSGLRQVRDLLPVGLFQRGHRRRAQRQWRRVHVAMKAL